VHRLLEGRIAGEPVADGGAGDLEQAGEVVIGGFVTYCRSLL
jgi:hypothetical protein